MTEIKQHEDKAKRPWPTKAVLSKYAATYAELDGRRYYSTSEVKTDEQVQEWVSDHMDVYDRKTHEALWCRLPPKTTSGGLPEEHEKYIFTRQSDKKDVQVEVVQVSTIKYSRERGTGFVIIKTL